MFSGMFSLSGACKNVPALCSFSKATQGNLEASEADKASKMISSDLDFSLTPTVSPGFSFEDFELKSQKELTGLFPQHEAIITKLTHH